MRAPSVAGCPIIQSGVKVGLLAVLIGLAACTNANNSYSNVSPPTPIASADSGNSVSKVSDALGQRLDGMLNSQHTAGR